MYRINQLRDNMRKKKGKYLELKKKIPLKKISSTGVPITTLSYYLYYNIYYENYNIKNKQFRFFFLF